jgi:hypothetical protein
MIFDSVIVGQTALVIAILIGIACFFVARKKTDSPKTSALLGFILGLIAPLGLIFLATLVLKKNNV